MEIVVIKVILVLALFATLITGAFWASGKIEEYREYWRKDEDGR